ncbi:MAG: carboxymuconolactone decarboxylase family protein [bacterium]|nr:carboxymuconolactone decarboxylase family protein [bacterium]
MDEITIELVAIGASVSAHCQPCLVYHLGKARELGVTELDIQEAIDVGFMIEKGAGNAMRNYAGELVNILKKQGDSCCPGTTSKCCG